MNAYFTVLLGLIIGTFPAQAEVPLPKWLSQDTLKADLLKTVHSEAAKEGFSKQSMTIEGLELSKTALASTDAELVTLSFDARIAAPNSSLSAKRTMAVIVRNDILSQTLFDPGFFQGDCGEPNWVLGKHSFYTVDQRNLLALELSKLFHACCGASEQKYTQTLFFEIGNPFKPLLELDTFHGYFGHADCSSEKNEAKKRKISFVELRPNGGNSNNYAWFDYTEWLIKGPTLKGEGPNRGRIEFNRDHSKLVLRR